MVKDVTKFHKYHLGVRVMLECVCTGFFVLGGGNSKVLC